MYVDYEYLLHKREKQPLWGFYYYYYWWEGDTTFEPNMQKYIK